MRVRKRISGLDKEILDDKHLADSAIAYDDTYDKSTNQLGQMEQQATDI